MDVYHALVMVNLIFQVIRCFGEPEQTSQQIESSNQIVMNLQKTHYSFRK
jgi:hypothetical protein